MKFTETAIGDLYDRSLAEAEEKLSSLCVAEGRTPKMKGLNGWVFEQTIRHCLSHEFEGIGFRAQIQEQVPLGGRAKVDLLVGRVAIELKVRGSFGAGDSKYESYRSVVEGRGWVYLYLTLQETYARYKQSTKETFGADRAFFLDTLGDWRRFVDAVMVDNP